MVEFPGRWTVIGTWCWSMRWRCLCFCCTRQCSLVLWQSSGRKTAIYAWCWSMSLCFCCNGHCSLVCGRGQGKMNHRLCMMLKHEMALFVLLLMCCCPVAETPGRWTVICSWCWSMALCFCCNRKGPLSCGRIFWQMNRHLLMVLKHDIVCVVVDWQFPCPVAETSQRNCHQHSVEAWHCVCWWLVPQCSVSGGK